MGKSSSSTRKKRSKYSSLDRGRKRSKTKRAKSKKLRRHGDSDSYSTDDSRSLSFVSSSSEDSYRGRKSRSSICTDAKGTKRRPRSQSSSSQESLSLRKRKGSSRKVVSDMRKKTLKHKKNKKKKSLRDATISSRSCSTCSSHSSDESEYESHRGRSRRRSNNLKSSKNVKNRSKKRRYRSRSCSSISRDSDSDNWREEKVTDGNISKRLRSVITFTNDDKEERELDEHKEEMTYEEYGYPSSRSNDSYDGGNRWISGNHSPFASEKKRSTENEKKDPFDIKTTELSNRCLGEDDKSVEGKPTSDGFGTNDSLGEKTYEIEATGKANNDLEIILRQKALENLRKFRGGTLINSRNNVTGKDENCDALKSPCPRKADLSQNDPKDDCAGVEGISVHSLREDKILDGKNVGNGSASIENNVCLANKVVAKRDNMTKTFRRGLNKQRLVRSALKQALSSGTTRAVEAPKVKLVNESGLFELDVSSISGKTSSDKVNNAGVSSSSCMASAGRDVEMNRSQDEAKETSRVEQRTAKLPESLSSAGDTVNDASGSNSAYDASAAEDVNLSKGEADGKEGSQLERKTMSVMRGGEMVQVSYKVYIPQKTPALARRQLKR